MKKFVQHPTVGEILYEENIWTGKVTLSVGEKKLEKIDKTTYAFSREGEAVYVYLQGNTFSGVKLKAEEQAVEVTKGATWYEIVCSILMFVLLTTWGNNRVLCSILPIVGGVIGGAINGMMAFLNLFVMRKVQSPVVKICIWLGILAVNVLMDFAVALLIIRLLV